MTDDTTEKQSNNAPGLGAIVLSTLAAAFGVQSSKNRERDFGKGNIKVYIISGLIFTVVFITTIVTLVKYLIKSAGM
ncbi:MAG: DUF2970 domain-containing protein [Pseudomonadales bacterium]|nr:DUF2970 domain-containing protein [Pseudomonadales bacterium]